MKRSKALAVFLAVLLALSLGHERVIAQGGPFSAQLENFWRLISTGGRTFQTLKAVNVTITGTCTGCTPSGQTLPVGVAAGSVLVSNGVGASPVYSSSPSITGLTVTGQALCADGTATSPCWSFTNETGLGWYRRASGRMDLATTATHPAIDMGNVGITVGSGGAFMFSTTATADAAQDIFIRRSAAKTLTIDTDGAGGNLTAINLDGPVVTSSTISTPSGYQFSAVTIMDVAASATRIAQWGAGGIQLNAANGVAVSNTLSAVTLNATTAYQFNGNAFATATVGPSSPVGTSSTTLVMAGLAGSITTRTGRIELCMSGTQSDGTISDGSKVQASFGTGGAPSNGAALTGTQVGPIITYIVPGATAAQGGYGSCWVVTGLVSGTTYWLDTAFAAVTGGTATITQASMAAHDIP